MMRLRSLTLDLFGHFSNRTYDFGTARPGTPDFHVIYGPNEAGKTTTMEGFLRLLYGFPNKEPYGFLHDRKNLQVSGTLDVDGTPLQLTRLSTRNGSLRDGNDAILPEAAIRAHLGGLSMEDYRQLLCLDDETIEKGGDEIVASNGDIGRLLFSAAAGISDLTGVLDQFRERADAIYRKRASSTHMAGLKKELAEVEHQIKELDVTASAYKKLKQALETAQTEEARAREVRQGLNIAKAELEALKAALPHLDECDRLEEELSGKETYPETLDVNPEKLVELLTRQTQLLAERERLSTEIRVTGDQLEALERQPEHLALLGALEELDVLRGNAKIALRDLPGEQASLQNIHAKMARAAADLNAPEETSPESLILTPAQMNELEELREQLRGLEQDLIRQKDEAAETEQRLKTAKDNLAENTATDETRPLVGPILARFSVDELAPQYASARQALKSAAHAREDGLADLTISGKPFGKLPSLALSQAEAEDLAQRHEALLSDHSKIAERQEETRRDLQTLAQQIEFVKTGSGLIDDGQALQARKERDRLWSRHKSELDADTASAFETAMARLDQIGEVRLSHASEIGELSAQSQRKIELETRIKTDTERLDRLEADIADIEKKLLSHAAQCGLDTLPRPSVFAVWVGKLEAAMKAERVWERLSREHEATLLAGQRLAQDLKASLALETDDFDTLVSRARARHAEEREHDERQRARKETCRTLMQELERRQAALETLLEKLNRRKTAWTELVSKLFGSALDPQILLQSLDPLRDLWGLEPSRLDVSRRIETMKDDQEAFAQEVTALAVKTGVDAAATPLNTFDALMELAQQAEKAEEQFNTLSAAREKAKATLSEVERTLADIDRQTTEISAAFPETIATGTLHELRHAVRDTQFIIDKRTRLSELTNSILSGLSVSDLTEARAKLQEKSLAELSADLNGVEDDLASAERALEAAIEQRSGCQRELAAVTGDSDVALLTERKATLELELEEAALSYLQLDYGLRLAEEAIRRYRDSHRSNMMQVTEATFADLTNGAYPKLTTQPQGKSETLVAIDASGKAKEAYDLSKGTRFQLYLALRAAAYGQLANQGTCLPFFCDDIFETFDENRTRSACHVMAQIGKTGQAIYLTHHQHVVDIAREVCGEGVTVHQI